MIRYKAKTKLPPDWYIFSDDPSKPQGLARTDNIVNNQNVFPVYPIRAVKKYVVVLVDIRRRQGLIDPGRQQRGRHQAGPAHPNRKIDPGQKFRIRQNKIIYNIFTSSKEISLFISVFSP